MTLSLSRHVRAGAIIAIVLMPGLGCKLRSDSQPERKIAPPIKNAQPAATGPQELSLLAGHAPRHPDNGFPIWYADADGLKLEQCIDPNDPMCLPPPANLDPALPVKFPSNFPDEFFYWNASTAVTTNDGGTVQVTMAHEGAFSTGEPVPGRRIVFSRIRMRGRNLSPGTYQITYPFGSKIFEVTADTGVTNFFFTEDISPIDENFGASLSARVGPFLRWDPRDTPAAPAGTIGDPGVPHRIIGSPFGINDVTVERLDEDRWDIVGKNDEWTIAGKIATFKVFAGPSSQTTPVLPKVTLVASEPDSSIFYTLDGEDPATSAGSRIAYSGPIDLALITPAPVPLAPITLKFAARRGSEWTPTVTETYTLDPSLLDVEASPAEGSFLTGPISVHLKPIGSATSIYYTTDDTDPLTSPTRTLYSDAAPTPDPIIFDTNAVHVLRYVAVNGTGATSKSYRTFYSLEQQRLAVGPVNPENGFPFWYSDGTHKLVPCLDPADPYCLPPPTNFDPALPVTFPNNFPDEMFYWAGGATATTSTGDQCLLTLALEGAFVNGVPAPGDRMVFARVRIRAKTIAPGRYRVTHPYGVKYFDVAPGSRGINYTDDIGLTAEQFDTATRGAIGPVLRWSSDGPPPPPGYVGDPGVDHAVTGSPLGTNYFKVERLDGATATEVAFTDQFSISGKLISNIVAVSPTGGFFNVPPTITLAAADSSATIMYTLDGSDPTPVASDTTFAYTGPITLTAPETTLKATAWLDGNPSPMSTQTYIVDNTPPEVTASPAPVPDTPFTAEQLVTLTPSETPVSIFYTLDGVDPHTSVFKRPYTGPLNIAPPGTKTLKFYAIDRAGNESPVVTHIYSFETAPPVATAPVATFVDSGATTLTLAAIPIRLDWNGSTTGTTIRRFELQRSINNGVFLPVTLPTPTSTTITTNLATGLTYRFRTRVIDSVGAASPWVTGTPFTLVFADEKDRNVAYVGRWTQLNVARALNARANFSVTNTNRGTFTFTGSQVMYIGVTRPNGAIGEVWIDNVKATDVDLYSPAIRGGQRLFVKNFGANGPHAIQIRATNRRNPLSTGFQTGVDGFIYMR